MARRSPAYAPPSRKPFPIAIVFGAGALGLGVFLLVRKAQAAVGGPAVGDSTTGTTPPPETVLQQQSAPPTATNRTPTPRPSPTPTRTVAQQPAKSAQQILEERLARTLAARRIFAFQAAGYSYGYTNSLPDGLWGQHSTTLLHVAQQANGQALTSTFTPGAMALLDNLIIRDGHSARALPFPLTQGTIDAVNRAAVAMDGHAAPLTVNASSQNYNLLYL